jgi:hypothetical protein
VREDVCSPRALVVKALGAESHEQARLEALADAAGPETDALRAEIARRRGDRDLRDRCGHLPVRGCAREDGDVVLVAAHGEAVGAEP